MDNVGNAGKALRGGDLGREIEMRAGVGREIEGKEGSEEL